MNTAGWCEYAQYQKASTPEVVLSQVDNPFKNRKEGSKEEVILGNQHESVLSSL